MVFPPSLIIKYLTFLTTLALRCHLQGFRRLNGWDEEGGMGCNTDLLLMVMALSSEGSGVEQLGGGGW